MYNLKNRRKTKNYWQGLILEVTGRKHKSNPPRNPDSPGICYSTQYQRRHIKYTLGEPMPSIYFTQREAECVMQILQGKTMNETGEILHLSPRTVEYYLGKIKRKLNCKKKREIIKLVTDTDFVKNFQQDPYNNKK
jgi:DNA-binding CsgD family transcriptional regulator